MEYYDVLFAKALSGGSGGGGGGISVAICDITLVNDTDISIVVSGLNLIIDNAIYYLPITLNANDSITISSLYTIYESGEGLSIEVFVPDITPLISANVNCIGAIDGEVATIIPSDSLHSSITLTYQGK